MFVPLLILIEQPISRRDSIGHLATLIFMLPFAFLVLCAYWAGIMHYIDLLYIEGHELYTGLIWMVIIFSLLLLWFQFYLKYMNFVMKKYFGDTQNQQQEVVQEC